MCFAVLSELILIKSNIPLLYSFQDNHSMSDTFISEKTLSLPDWPGLKSSKFYGGRVHHNHPIDELDHLLVSQHPNYKKPLGS